MGDGGFAAATLFFSALGALLPLDLVGKHKMTIFRNGEAESEGCGPHTLPNTIESRTTMRASCLQRALNVDSAIVLLRQHFKDDVYNRRCAIFGNRCLAACLSAVRMVCSYSAYAHVHALPFPQRLFLPPTFLRVAGGSVLHRLQRKMR